MDGTTGTWIKTLLLGETARERETAAQTLGKGGPQTAKAAVPALIEALADEDEKVRSAAAFALAEFGPAAKAAVPALTQMIVTADGISGCWGAVHALGEIGLDAAPAVPQLILLLRHGGMIAQQIAPEALGKIGPAAQAAVPALVEALRYDKRAGAKAAEALGRMGAAAQAAVPALIAALGYDDRIAVEAVQALGRLGPAVVPHLPTLLQQAQNPAWPQRDRANETLRALGPLAEEAIPSLLAALQDKNDAIRLYAAVSLWNINRRNNVELLREVEQALIAALRSDDKEVRREAAKALGDTQDFAYGLAARLILERFSVEARLSPLEAALAQAMEDSVHAVRKAAAEALWKSDCGVAVENLARLLKNGGAAGVTAAQVLWEKDNERIGEVLPVLIEAVKGANLIARRLALQVLERMGPAAKPAVVALCAALYDVDARVRGAAADALGELHELAKPEALTALTPALRDPVARVRIHAAEALWLLDAECVTAREIVVAALAAGDYDLFNDVVLMVSRMRGLGRAGLPILLSALQNGGDAVREAAAGALDSLGSEARPAVPALLQAAQSGPLSLRFKAAVALWKINGQTDPVLPVILEALASKTMSRVRQWIAFEILGRMGPAAKPAVPILRAAAQAEDYHLARLAAAALENIE